MEYGSHRNGGYPIGSGAIESAHRFIAQVRLKRSGARWYEASSNHMPALRCAKYNGTLEPFDDSVPRMLREQGVSSHLISGHLHYWETGGATYHTQYTTCKPDDGRLSDVRTRIAQLESR